MKEKATYEAVINACEQLQRNGQKITGRAVVSIIGGGSLGTVLSHIKTWRQHGTGNSPAASTEIPADLQTAIVKALTLAQDHAKEKLQGEIDQSTLRETEALEGLAEAEKKIEETSGKLADTIQQLTETKQAADTAAAIANEKTTSLTLRVDALETERRQLIESAEIARTEAAKAMLQIERADQATVKAEKRLQDIEAQFAAIQQQKTESDKRAALAEQKNELQAELLADIRSSFDELKKEKAALVKEKNEKIAKHGR